MRHRRFGLGAALTVVCVVTGVGVALTQDGGPSLTVEQWRADLQELATHVRENHRRADHTMSAAEFDAAVAEIDERIPLLQPRQITLELARLLASIGDGHTRLTFPVSVDNLGYQQAHTKDPEPAPGAPRFHTLPVRFADFEEGLHIASATSEHRALLGARVLKIGSQPVEDALTALEPFVAHDTPAGLRFQATKLLSIGELLAETGASPDAASTTLVVSTMDGAEEEVTLPSLDYGDQPRWLYPAGQEPRDVTGSYFSLDTSLQGTLVVNVYQINDSPNETLGAFSRRIVDALDRLRPDRVILDLRQCHGGDQSLSRALVLPFVRWSPASVPGHLFALVGPETFSAAVNLASRLEEWTQVTFVGEPLGSGPSHYSSSDREVLDHSQLVVRVSTGYFVGWTGTEWRESVELGVPVKTRIADYLSGVDTVMRAAVAFEPEADVTAQLVQAYEASGINTALISWARYRTDPLTTHLAEAEVGNGLARYLFDAGKLEYAAAIFLFNREFHPSSIDAYLGEAEARRALGEPEQALTILEEARALSPKDDRVTALIAEIENEQ